MNEMIVKSVDVLGSTVMAAQDNDGTIWVGIKWMCQGMGMTDGQCKRQINNIQKDLLLKNSGSNLVLNRSSGEREVFCLKLDYLPIWLAKISITPTIQQENPDLAKKLLDYQLKAKDILAAAFLPKKDTQPLTLREQVKTIAASTIELYEKVEGLEERFNKLESDMPVFTSDAKDIQDALKKKVVSILGGKQSNAYKDNSVRGYAFADIQIELRRQFGVRRYDQIKHKDVDVALRIIREYKPPFHIKNKIEMANAQQSFNLGGAGE